MVKRRKQEDAVGVLEFEGRSSEDPTFKQWLAEHKAGNGGKLRVSKGATGVRVMFSKEADMAFWKDRSDMEAKGQKPHAA
jgi:hypothetical protein